MPCHASVAQSHPVPTPGISGAKGSPHALALGLKLNTWPISMLLSFRARLQARDKMFQRKLNEVRKGQFETDEAGHSFIQSYDSAHTAAVRADTNGLISGVSGACGNHSDRDQLRFLVEFCIPPILHIPTPLATPLSPPTDAHKHSIA